jgi:hypothetical protein
MRQRILPIHVLLVVVLTIAPLIMPTHTAHAQSEEAYLVQKVNELRASQGLNTLSWNGALATAAYGHSAYLAARIYTGNPHYEADGSGPQDRATRNGYSGRASENVVGGRTATAEYAFNWWMNSRVHYRNMLGNWNEVGVGIVDGGERGKWYTMMFGNAGAAPIVSNPNAGSSSSSSGSSGGSVAVRPTKPPPPTYTPSVTFTPSITFTPRATFTPTFTPTFLPATETPIVIEITPQNLPTESVLVIAQVPSETPTDTPSPSPIPVTEVAVVVESSSSGAPPPGTAIANSSVNPLRQLIPVIIALNLLIVGGFVVRSITRRNR